MSLSRYTWTGAAVLIAAIAGGGTLLIGPALDTVPTGAINAVLAASPVVMTAAAANIDLFHTDLLYRLSPIGHGRYDYPAWYASTAWFTAFALVAWSIAVLRAKRSA